MNTSDTQSAAPAPGVGCGELVLPLPSAEEIEITRSALNGAKLRKGSKMTIDTKAMKTRIWPIIEVWVKEKRRYLTLSVGDVWRSKLRAACGPVDGTRTRADL